MGGGWVGQGTVEETCVYIRKMVQGRDLGLRWSEGEKTRGSRVGKTRAEREQEDHL